ncbi:dihydrolipoyl dehydrogenase family protein [Alkalicoccus halolimnae]|uniref:NAD(P)/FAD-dependent oxidoreductase n=1 Tax=Alkalicoccus halolimnae TaxID=1667239 RepID=A0A5C7FMI3_9BACI|nr:NAD(P)/FAD-dependent oxidoreductase [Alkalicoccus halolimnae]TXF86586.1 NAD(P)/FAD-dependent oxidoreductase [Alkalicoccus halolimnae]
MKKYDIIVIGGGSGGLTAASGAAQFGAKTALIEKQNSLGGDCLHYGCVPSKALIAAASELHDTHVSAKKHGLVIDGKPDWQKVRSQIQKAVDTIQEHDSTERFQKLGVDVIYAEASFEDAHRLRLSNGQVIKGKRIVIATGSRPIIPEIENVNLVDVITNESVFYMEKLPENIVMVGGGAIGLEMAQALSRVGASVTVVDNAPDLLLQEDEDISVRASREFKKEVTIHLKSTVKKLERHDDGVFAVIEGEVNKKVKTDALFLAVGRNPNIDLLKLDNAGVERNEKAAISVNERMQTSVPHIYAVGDVNGKFPFTHGAGEEAKVVIANAVFGLKMKMDYSNLPWAFYTQPEIFHLGQTEKEVIEQSGKDYEVIKADNPDRMIAEQDEVSFVKVIIDRKGFILGAHGIGKNASDWMQTLVYMKTKGHKIKDISEVVHPYPARTEIVKQLADQYWNKKLFKSRLTGFTKTYIKYLR